MSTQSPLERFRSNLARWAKHEPGAIIHQLGEGLEEGWDHIFEDQDSLTRDEINMVLCALIYWTEQKDWLWKVERKGQNHYYAKVWVPEGPAKETHDFTYTGAFLEAYLDLLEITTGFTGFN